MKFKEHASESSTGAGSFLKISDGESISGVFVGEVYEFYTKWVGGKSLVTASDDADAKLRFRCNFITTEKNSEELAVKIWEFPLMIYNQLKEINEEYPLEETKVKITRKGTGTNTEYTIMPLVGGKNALKAEQVALLKKIPLLKLEKKASQPVSPPTGERDIEQENWT